MATATHVEIFLAVCAGALLVWRYAIAVGRGDEARRQLVTFLCELGRDVERSPVAVALSLPSSAWPPLAVLVASMLTDPSECRRRRPRSDLWRELRADVGLVRATMQAVLARQVVASAPPAMRRLTAADVSAPGWLVRWSSPLATTPATARRA